jgi:hypothetical protein
VTFTFDSSLSTDLAKVRFHIGDTTEAGAYLADETINYWVEQDATLGEAIIHCIQYIISQLSTPQFSADGFSISTTNAIAGYQSMLKQKQQEFGISNTSAKCVIKHAHRADSYEYSDELNADGLHYDDPSGGD